MKIRVRNVDAMTHLVGRHSTATIARPAIGLAPDFLVVNASRRSDTAERAQRDG
jgi:hypothetical protein